MLQTFQQFSFVHLPNCIEMSGVYIEQWRFAETYFPSKIRLTLTKPKVAVQIRSQSKGHWNCSFSLVQQ